MRRFLYLPIESKVRELDAKILLAIEAINNDYIVIIGSKILMGYLDRIEQGILIYKDSSFPMEKKFERYKKYGHRIVVHDEEGFVQSSWDDYLNRRIKFGAINYVDLFLCWGKEQERVLAIYLKEIDGRVALKDTGHPRIDLLRKPIRSYNYNSVVKDGVILISLKFSEVNHRLGKDGWIDLLKLHKMIKSDAELDLRYAQIEYKKRLLERYVELITELSLKFPQMEIVVRPHPVENVDTWKEITRHIKKVVVTNEKPIGYWVHQANVVIHTGCTTALEAFIMDKPVIAYKPIVDERFEISLPDSISFKAHTKDECCDLVSSLVSVKYDFDAYKQAGNTILSSNISSLEGEFAFKKIVVELNKLNAPLYKVGILKRATIRSMFFVQKVKDTVRSLKKNREYNRSISMQEVRGSVTAIQESLNDKGKVVIDKLASDVFMLWR